MSQVPLHTDSQLDFDALHWAVRLAVHSVVHFESVDVLHSVVHSVPESVQSWQPLRRCHVQHPSPPPSTLSLSALDRFVAMSTSAVRFDNAANAPATFLVPMAVSKVPSASLTAVGTHVYLAGGDGGWGMGDGERAKSEDRVTGQQGMRMPEGGGELQMERRAMCRCL